MLNPRNWSEHSQWGKVNDSWIWISAEYCIDSIWVDGEALELVLDISIVRDPISGLLVVFFYFSLSPCCFGFILKGLSCFALVLFLFCGKHMGSSPFQHLGPVDHILGLFSLTLTATSHLAWVPYIFTC